MGYDKEKEMITEINYKFQYTNSCTCTYMDVDTGESIESDQCFGDCFEFQIEDFSNCADHLFINNETNWWRIKGLRLWDGDKNGLVHAKTPEELLRGMTVNSEWTIRGTIYADKIEYSLSHHDAPMGSHTVVEIVTEEQREEWGLY